MPVVKERLRVIVETDPTQIYSLADRRLCARTIAQAIVDLTLPPRNGRMEADSRDARAWFESKRDDDHTFVWCCEILGMDPSKIRNAVLSGKMDTRRFNVQYFDDDFGARSKK